MTGPSLIEISTCIVFRHICGAIISEHLCKIILISHAILRCGGFFLDISIDLILESTMKCVNVNNEISSLQKVQLEQCVSLNTFSYVFCFAFNLTPIPTVLSS